MRIACISRLTQQFPSMCGTMMIRHGKISDYIHIPMILNRRFTQAMLNFAWQLPRSSSSWKVPMPRWVSQRTNKASHEVVDYGVSIWWIFQIWNKSSRFFKYQFCVLGWKYQISLFRLKTLVPFGVPENIWVMDVFSSRFPPVTKSELTHPHVI